MILAATAKLGFIADLLSKPTMIGYMNGLAVTILIGQLPKLFGFSIDADNLIQECTGFVKGLANGDAVPAAAAVGLAGIVLILVLQRWLPKVPAVLVDGRAVHLRGGRVRPGRPRSQPGGHTAPRLPAVHHPERPCRDLAAVFAGAAGIALVSLADTISTASSFAARSGQEIHGNQEMVGIGAANLAAGLFQGFPVSTSGSRTAVAERSGREDATHRSDGRRADHRHDRRGTWPVPRPAATGARRDSDHRGAVAGRHSRDRAVVAPAADGVPAVNHRVPWRRTARCAAGIGDRRGAVHPQRLPTGVVALSDRARASRRAGGLSRRPLLPGRTAFARTGHLPVRRPIDLRQRRRRSATRSAGWPAARPKPQWIVVAAEPITDVDTTARTCSRSSTKR